MSRDSKKAGEAFSTLISLDPGFRFHPTDEELVSYYLKKKVLGKPIRYDVIEELDIYKHEPWDLTDYSKLKTRDQEWFFFSTGACVNRSTKEGYWRKTGDKAIRGGDDESIIGIIKSLVFYSGLAPDGFRTNWLMHQYHLVENEHEENHLQSKKLIDLNELWKEFEIDVDDDDEPLKRESTVPLSLIQNKRVVNSTGNFNSSSQTTKDHCFSTETIMDTYALTKNETETEPVATIVHASPCSYTKMINDLQNENELEPVATIVSSSSFTKMINDLQDENELDPVAAKISPSSSTKMIIDLMKKKHEMVIVRETHKVEMKKVQVMIKVLQKKIDTLLVENKELKKKIRNKGIIIEWS